MLASLSVPAAAQMQIPNPLIRPRSISNPVPSDIPQLPGANAQRGTTNPGATAAYPPISGNPGGPQYADDAAARELNELKERFATFYVSAISGKEAVLRRSQAQRIGLNPAAAGLQPVGSSMAPVPFGAISSQSQPTARNEALMLRDGESFEATGNVGSLLARISNRQVVIYRVQENTQRRAIIFVGELETSGSPAQPAIVLERPDPAYKRSISVETKTRSASAPQTDSTNVPPLNPPALPPQ
ncbi:hypothetical protein GCM10022212_30310 [Actimicrobium antarcticum]|uniref:Type II secretion system protein GspC N-terminal domain-containing protein n=2 Tax=Actimicrobium antarcticum TaxID=1051899 RepID=A0ABP7TRR4_9BURK